MDAGQPRSVVDRGYLVGLVGVLSLEGAGATYQVVTGVPVPVVTVVAAAFALACILRVHGLWGAMAFVALIFVIPFGSEFLGVLTGFPYGAYTYSGLVGPRLLGIVPVFIFIAWINIGYLVIATTTFGLGRSSLWLAPLDGVLAAAWDAIVDPVAVRAGYWTWADRGGFYGVPVSNFLGWVLVVTLLSVVARTVWANDARAPAGTARIVIWVVPTLLLGTSLAFGAIAAANGLVYAAFVGNVVIIPAVIIAFWRVRRTPSESPARNPWSESRRVAAAPERS